MNSPHHTAHRRASVSAPLTPEPYLLDKGPFPIRRPSQNQPSHKPLRLIKPAPGRSACERGKCLVMPGCTDRCRAQQADEALRSHYNARHTQRAAMPTTTEHPSTTHRERRIVWALLIAWCIGCLGLGLWLAWSALA